MIIRVLSTSLVAGFLAGVLVAVIQHFTTTPLILAAEVFESQAAEAPSLISPAVFRGDDARLILAHADHDTAAGGEEGWAPADGIERTLYTSTVTIATAIGFAFLLLAGLLASGDRIDPQRALMWGAAGFVVTGLAPALGLAPELPGMPAADLIDRQVWWIATAVATGGALWLILRSRSLALQILGVALLVAPHVIGAPHLHGGEVSRVPAELAARFAATSLAVHAVLWAATGLAVGWFWQWTDSTGRA